MIDWIREELAKEEIFASNAGIIKVLNGDQHGFEDTVVDFILSCRDEWDDAG